MMTKTEASTDKLLQRSQKTIQQPKQKKNMTQTAASRVNMNERAFILERMKEKPKINLLE